MPVGAPLAFSFRISPPKGFGVSAVIWAIRKAALFTIAACPSARVRNAGLSGAISSRSAAVGKTGGVQKVSIQPRPVTHFPGDPLLDAGEELFAGAGAFKIEVHLAFTNAKD